jgi:hypothetical protein
MALQSSGAISLGDVNVELGNARTDLLAMGSTEARALAEVLSGTIKMSDFYGQTVASSEGDRLFMIAETFEVFTKIGVASRSQFRTPEFRAFE